jgi:hypothetical protein
VKTFRIIAAQRVERTPMKRKFQIGDWRPMP